MARTFEMREPVYRHVPGLASGIPLGGLGAGSVELRDDGRFHDWEIFNNYSWSGDISQAPPHMWSEDAFFALRVKQHGRDPKVRLLYHDDMKSQSVAPQYDHAIMYNYPFLRNVAAITYSGQYPFACLAYEEAGLPVELELRAFSPFIPFNAKDSALPLAFFVFTVRNRSDRPCEASLMTSVRNCVGYDLERMTLRHVVRREGDATFVLMTADDVDPAHRTAGSMAVGVLGDGVSHMAAWTDGRGMMGFERPAAPALSQLFYPFRDEGKLSGAEDEWSHSVQRRDIKVPCGELHCAKRQVGWRWRGAVCRKLTLAPGEEAEVVFLLSWFFPNHYHYFATDRNLGHMYANWFSGADDVAEYAAENYARLHAQSRAFCDSLYAGTTEPWLAASLNAQLTTFPQSFWWTKSGDLAAWEGSACCQLIAGARTHWSSWQPLMFFPELYLEMNRRMAAFRPPPQEDDESFLALEWRRRHASSRQQRNAFGGWYEQRYKALGYDRQDFVRTPQARRTGLGGEGSAIQLLRDYQWTGDEDYLRALWPVVRDGVEAGAKADTNGDGLPDGQISFITYDHWFLPATNCYRCTMWLVELKAAARIAQIAGEDETAARFTAIAERGAASFEKLFWNGEYYDLCYDPRKQAADEGCMADQVSGHLYARLCGLGPIHPPDHVRSALRAVHRHNRQPEEGLLNGADPRGRDDWRYFCRYSARGDDEALAGQWVTPWTGTEYYVAAAMVAEGLVEEGLDVARDIYERHAAVGMLYNQIECGEHYFRPMAAWALLPALQGLVYDAATGKLRFAPKASPEDFDMIFVLPVAWGRLRQERAAGLQSDVVRVESGALAVRTIVLERAGEPTSAVTVEADGRRLECRFESRGGEVVVSLSERLVLRAGNRLAVDLE